MTVELEWWGGPRDGEPCVVSLQTFRHGSISTLGEWEIPIEPVYTDTDVKFILNWHNRKEHP